MELFVASDAPESGGKKEQPLMLTVMSRMQAMD